MKNFVQPGKTITVPAPAAVASGDAVFVGNLFGVAATDAAQDEDVEITTEGVFDLPKAAEDIDLGDPLYWDDTAGVLTTTGTDNNLVGAAIAAALAADALVRIRLNGSFGIVGG